MFTEAEGAAAWVAKWGQRMSPMLALLPLAVMA